MREWIVESEDAGMRLRKWLGERTDARSRGRAAEWLTRGKVYVNGQPVETESGARPVSAGDRVGIWMDRPGSSKSADRAVREARHLLRVIHEDGSIVVVDKP